MKITKMHALGNNYIYVSLFEENLSESEYAQLAIAVSDVRRGIGSDGLILIGPSNRADVRMRIFNADGSEAETCGNGLRCVAKFAVEHGYVESPVFKIEVQTGVVEAHANRDEDGKVHQVTIDMGAPVFGSHAVGYSGESPADDAVDVETAAGVVQGTLVSMGNPHFVSFVEDAVHFPVEQIGPQIERHPAFPRRINVEFVTPRTKQELDFRVWERGSGITYACGTGACASVAAGIKMGLLDGRVRVHLLGGDLDIELADNGHIWMTGEAVEVFTGAYQWPSREMR